MWSRWGPYHVARFRGAAAVAKCNGSSVCGLEISSTDEVYDWNVVERSDGELWKTVFPGRRYDDLTGPEMRTGVVGALNTLKPNVVAINGWSVPEARAALSWRRRTRSRRAVLMSETKQDDIPRRWWREWAKRIIVRQFDTALVGGRKQAEYLRKLGFREDRIFAGYDAVDNGYFNGGVRDAKEEGSRLRIQFGIPANYFICCTRFIRRKNVDGLLKAYGRYRDRCSGEPWGLVVLGSGVEETYLRRLAVELRLKGVVWPGFVQYDMLPVYYGLASAFVHPAKSEPWGLVVNEAAASGLPLLVSRTVGAQYELVEDGRNGYLLDPFDYEDMAGTMLRTAALSTAARKQMGRISQQIVAEWSPQRFGEQLLAAADLALSLPGR